MEEKRTHFAESTGNDINKLVSDLGWEIVLKISHLPSKLGFSAKYSFLGQYLSRGNYQRIYQPSKGAYLLDKLIHHTS